MARQPRTAFPVIQSNELRTATELFLPGAPGHCKVIEIRKDRFVKGSILSGQRIKMETPAKISKGHEAL